MKEVILVSACLLGDNCKYNGGNNRNEKVLEYLEGREYIKICPETMGGLESPRSPSEIEPGFCGGDVLEGRGGVYSREGCDVTENFVRGAEKALEAAEKYGAKKAILKESSPSCGSSSIYDGSFSKTKKAGAGVCAALLMKNGVDVVSEKDIR